VVGDRDRRGPAAVWERNKTRYFDRWDFYASSGAEMGDPDLEYGLAPSEEGSRWSEKKAVINHPERPDSGAGYAHVTHERCAELTHVELHADPSIVSMVGRLISASMVKELGPVLTGLMVSGRVGSTRVHPLTG